jgi:hypothetical protein
VNSFLMRVNRLSTRKKGLKTNRKDVLNVEPQKNNKWETGAVATVAVAVVTGVVTETPVAAATGGNKAYKGQCSLNEHWPFISGIASAIISRMHEKPKV